MKRNMEKIAAETKKNERYDLTQEEITELLQGALGSTDGTIHAITTAFSFGYAMGCRATKAAEKSAKK